MYDKAVREADRQLAGAVRKIESLYPDALAPVLKKHKATFDKLEKLEKEGAWGRARVLIRKSGLVDDLARALAAAGTEAADVIRAEIARVKEVARSDDPQEA